MLSFDIYIFEYLKTQMESVISMSEAIKINENKKYQDVETVPKSNRKTAERDKIDTSNKSLLQPPLY
jgi:hypothetical protein